MDFPDDSVVKKKNRPTNAGDSASIPELGRSSARGGKGNPLPYSCLRKLIDRGAWWATITRVRHKWVQKEKGAAEDEMVS